MADPNMQRGVNKIQDTILVVKEGVEHVEQQQQSTGQRLASVLEKIDGWLRGSPRQPPSVQPGDPNQPTTLSLAPGQQAEQRGGLWQGFLGMLGSVAQKAGLTSPRPELRKVEEDQPQGFSLMEAMNNLLGTVGEKVGIEGVGKHRERVEGLKEELGKDKEAYREAGETAKHLGEEFKKASQELSDARKKLAMAQQYGGDVSGARKAWKGAYAKRRGALRQYARAHGREKRAKRAVQKTRQGLQQAYDKVKEFGGQGFKVDWTQFADKGIGAAHKFGKKAGLIEEGGDIDKTLGSMTTIASNVPRAMTGDPTAIANIAVEGVKMTVDNIKAVGGHLKNVGRAGDAFMKSERAEDLMGSAAAGTTSASKAFARAAGGPVLGPVLEKIADNAPWVKLQEAIVGTIGKLREWGDQLHEANMRFAEFSGTMGNVQARQEQREFELNQTRGNRRAASAEYLAEGKQGLDKKMSVIEDAAAIMKNRVVGTLDRMVTKLIEITPVIGPLLQWLELVLGGGDDVTGLDTMKAHAHDYAQAMEARERLHGRPPGRFPEI